MLVNVIASPSRSTWSVYRRCSRYGSATRKSPVCRLSTACAEANGWTTARHSRPPGRSTRPISPTAPAKSSTSSSDIQASTSSALSSATGSAAASPISTVTPGSAAAAAAAASVGARSMPMIRRKPSPASSRAARPSPQPTSTTGPAPGSGSIARRAGHVPVQNPSWADVRAHAIHSCAWSSHAPAKLTRLR